MLTRIDLELFKCFEKLELSLSNLTILSGMNSSGKSSILHALVLLNQSTKEDDWLNILSLNGNTIQLGTVADVIDQINGQNQLKIGLIDDIQNQIDLYFSSEKHKRLMYIKKIIANDQEFLFNDSNKDFFYLYRKNATLQSINIYDALKNLSYITAERIGPREFYSLIDNNSNSVVGTKGEFAASVLFQGKDNIIHSALLIKDISPNLLNQVEARMQTFFPELRLDIQEIKNTNLLTLNFRTSNATNFHRPIHVGFGITQVFPIVVAALSMEKDGLLLIENPEVHLHPSGQVLMGQFLAEVANSGIQVIIETHSDHILNGVRRAVKNKKITNDKVNIHFFKARSENKNESQVISPQIDSEGSIDHWPKGFFDQFDIDSNFFAGWGD